MTNVFTRKHKHPRCTTLLDFKEFDPNTIMKPAARLLSPTRMANPHPHGLEHQNIPNNSSYLIWHPDFGRKSQHYEKMGHHMKFQNFTCLHPPLYNYNQIKAKVPEIKYTENTIMRSSYVNPSRFPDILQMSGFGSKGAAAPNFNSKAVIGIEKLCFGLPRFYKTGTYRSGRKELFWEKEKQSISPRK